MRGARDSSRKDVLSMSHRTAYRSCGFGVGRATSFQLRPDRLWRRDARDGDCIDCYWQFHGVVGLPALRRYHLLRRFARHLKRRGNFKGQRAASMSVSDW